MQMPESWAGPPSSTILVTSVLEDPLRDLFQQVHMTAEGGGSLCRLLSPLMTVHPTLFLFLSFSELMRAAQSHG